MARPISWAASVGADLSLRLHGRQTASPFAMASRTSWPAAIAIGIPEERGATPHMRRAGGKSTRHEEEASGGAVGVLKAPAPAPCEVVCRDRVGWEEHERCLDRCRWGAYVRRVLLHLKLVGRESATHEEARGGADVVTAMAGRLSDACKDFCTNHKHFDWCVHRCRFGPHLRLAGAGGESEEASRGAVDVLRATAAVDPRICEEFCRYWPEPDHDDCVKLCLIGAYVQQAHPHLKLAVGEYLTDEEEATGGAAEIPKAAMVRIPDRCVFFCRDRVEDYESCLFSCRTGAPVHHKLVGGSGAGESTTRKEEAPGGAVHVHVPAAQVQHEAAAGAQPMNTDPCEAYCKTHARDFPAKYDVCVRRCRSGGQPGRETMVQDEEASGGVVDVPAAEAAPVHHEAVAGAQPMKNTDPCEGYCMEQTRYFPRPGQFFDCVEECHAGHGRLTGDGRNGILRRVKQEPEKKPQLGLGTGNIAME